MLEITEVESRKSFSQIANGEPFFETKRTVQWVGSVSYGNFIDVIEAMTLLQEKNRNQVINLLVSSPGGQTGIAMSFYDLVKGFYRPNLQTIGSGDVDSSAIIVFLAGRQRFVTPNTTMFIHLGGRTMDGDRRFSSAEINSMAREDKIKDRQYATLLAKESGRLTTNEVLRLMQKNTVLTAAEIVKLGLAHCII